MNYKCPVCKKVWPTSMLVAKHIFGTNDKPHRSWVDEQGRNDGYTLDDLLIQQVTMPGNHSYRKVSELVEAAQYC
jgi:hypothetical protein